MVSGANEGIDRRLVVFCDFLGNLGLSETLKFEKESRAFGRTKSHPAVGAREATGRSGKRC